MSSGTQNYANHAHQPRQTLIAALFAFVALGLLVTHLFKEPTLVNGALVSLTASVIVLVSISRAYIVKLQDRIIRTEMRMRLERLGRGADFDRLEHRQLIALRFASDAEMPALIDRAIREKLSSKDIKQAVKDWQADDYRT